MSSGSNNDDAAGGQLDSHRSQDGDDIYRRIPVRCARSAKISDLDAFDHATRSSPSKSR